MLEKIIMGVVSAGVFAGVASYIVRFFIDAYQKNLENKIKNLEHCIEEIKKHISGHDVDIAVLKSIIERRKNGR